MMRGTIISRTEASCNSLWKLARATSLASIPFYFLSAYQANAQGVSFPDPTNYSVSAENVDPVSGMLALNIPEFMMGNKQDPLPIYFTRIYRPPTRWTTNIDPLGEGWSHSYVMGAHFRWDEDSQKTTINIMVGKEQYDFDADQIAPGQWTYYNHHANGAHARSERVSGVTTTILTTHDGYQYYFPHDINHSSANDYMDKPNAGWSIYGLLTAMISKIIAPNGEELNFTYAVSGNDKYTVRLDGIRHSRGYGVIFKYISAATSGPRTAAKQTVSEVILADSLCPSFPYGCNESTFRKMSFTYNYQSPGGVEKYTLSSFKNADLNESRYSYQLDSTYYGQNRYYLSGIFTPSDTTTPSITFSYTNQIFNGSSRAISSVTLAGNATTFAYPTAINCNLNVRETKRTAPDGGETRYRYPVRSATGNTCDHVPFGALSEVVDHQGNTTLYNYNFQNTWLPYSGRNQLLKVTNPEGDFTQNTIDARGNITSTIKNPKPGSSVSSTTSIYNFPACTSTNFRTCNKPDYEIDGRGGRTDYVWSDIHGGAISTTRPADANGLRPETSFQYTAFTGVDGATFYLPTSQTEKINATESVTTAFEYDPSGFRLKGKAVTSGGQTLRTCYSHDARGYLISETAPRANLSVCP